MKFEIFDLKYHYFDTKNVQFGEICGLDAQTEVYYDLSKIEIVLTSSSDDGRQKLPKWIENKSIAKIFFRLAKN